jgi:beta-mannosidase
MNEANHLITQRINSLLLNGTWQYLPDAEGSFSIGDVKKMYGNERSFSKMRIPQNWQPGGLNNFSGSVWFIKDFNFESEVTDDVKIIKFCGIDYFADVWLNWNYLGHHEGYFQHFFFRIEKELNAGENILIVKVSSLFEEPYKVWPSKKKQIKGIFNHHDCRPGGTSYEHGQDQNTGGIWNDVLIKSGYPVYIDLIKVSSKINYTANCADFHINIEYISLIKPATKIPIELEIKSPSSHISNYNIELELLTGTNEIDFSVQIENPELWWSRDLGNADLYTIKISSEFFEEQKIIYGIREVHLNERKQFFINNKRLFLRGTNIIPEQFLSELSKEKISKIVRLIKEANINIVRIHAHVNRKELYEEFDKQGILVWQDFSLQWTYDDSSEFINNAASQIKDMVKQLYNYASIVFWCCHNEPGEQTSTLDPILFQAVNNEDGQRIIRQSSNYEEHPYDGWYWGNKEHFAGAPMGPLVTEFGAQALPNLSSLEKFIPKEDLFPPKLETWQYYDFQADQTFNIAKIDIGNNIDSFIKNSQVYQTNLLQTAIDFYRRKKFKGINGIFQFMFIDCWPSITWSIVDFYLEPKPGYFTLKKAFQPIYISINVRQDQYFTGKKFLFDIYLINDLHKNFSGCKLNFFIDEKFYHEFENISIDSDDIAFLKHELFNFKIPDTLQTGNHKMKIELMDKSNNELLSANDFSFSIVENPGKNL